MNATLLATNASLLRSQFTLRRWVPALSPVDVSPDRAALDVAIRDADRGIYGVRLASAAISSGRVEIGYFKHMLLVKSVKPTIKFARTHVPRIREVAALHAPRYESSVGSLLICAYALKTILELHETAFRLAGLPDTALPLLAARTSALETETRQLTTNQAWLERARQELTEALGRGRSAIDGLDAQMLAQFCYAPHVIDAWHEAKRIDTATDVPVRDAWAA